MSAIIISDLHSHSWPRFSTTLKDGTNSRFQDLLNVLDQVEHYIDEHRPEHLIVKGDLTHRRRYVEFGIYNRLVEWLVHMNEKTKVVVMVGNHDIESTGVHSLTPLQHMGIQVIDRPKAVDLGQLGMHYFVPYMHGNAVVEAIQLNPRSVRKGTYLFTHYAFDGKILDNEFAVPSALKKSDADAFEKIFLGHIHSPSVEDDGRIVYVGAPLHFDFGDHGKRYAWHLLPGGVIEALPLYAPQFMTTSYTKVPVAPLEHSGFLRVLGVPRNLFGDVKKSALDNGWLDVVVQEQIVPDDAIHAIAASSVMVSDAMVREYVTQQYADIDDAAREQIIQMGLDYLRLAEEQ